MENIFYEYEKSFDKIIEKLITLNNPLWRGFITVNSPIVENPDILFIGINPGDGLFKEQGKVAFRTTQLYSELFPFDRDDYSVENLKFRDDGQIELDYFTDGNYTDGVWYNCRCKNQYVSNMLKIISKVAEYKTGEHFIKGVKPKWYDRLGKSVMVMNINPIVTKDVADLKTLMKAINVDNWQDIILPLRILVRDTIKPKTIVFMGVSAYCDFIRDGERKVDRIFGIPHITVNRSYGWGSTAYLESIAKNIVDNI
ncbi:MAG: hypothetical protein R3Y22_09650 [Bacteroidales bacterium]